MSNKPQFSLVGRAEDDEAHGCYNDHVDPSSTRDFVGNPAFPHYLLTNDSGWTPTLSDEVYEDLYQAQELQNTEQQLYYPEEGDLFADVETYMETKRNFSESLQVVTDEVLTDDILRNTLEPQQFVAAFRQESPQQCVRSNSDHLSQRGRTRQIETVPYINGMHHIIPNASSPLEVEANRPTQYEVGSETLFRGSFNQSEGALLSHDVPILRPSSKSQPCHPLHGELNDKVFDPIQKRNNGERRRVGIKQLCDTLLTHRQCEEPVQQRTSGVQPISCHKSDGRSKTLCHQRSTASRAICEIIKGNIKPTIDPVTGCYVVQLHDLRGPRRAAANESTRCVEKQTIGDGRKMADSARIERAPQLVTNSIPATSSSLRRNLPFNSGIAHRRRVELEEHCDDDTIVDVGTVDDFGEKTIEELVACALPSRFWI
uniref:C2H2-type domain-containing protein n=1 Tax=Angiostrongylus cantonensis TaxID=6313 RepID=A0A0K0CTQ5_ANGCA